MQREFHVLAIGEPKVVARWHLVRTGPDKVLISVHSLPPSLEAPTVRDFDTLPEPHAWALAFRRAPPGGVVYVRTPANGSDPVPMDRAEAQPLADPEDWEALHGALHALAAQRWERWARWLRIRLAEIPA